MSLALGQLSQAIVLMFRDLARSFRDIAPLLPAIGSLSQAPGSQSEEIAFGPKGNVLICLAPSPFGRGSV